MSSKSSPVKPTDHVGSSVDDQESHTTDKICSCTIHRAPGRDLCHCPPEASHCSIIAGNELPSAEEVTQGPSTPPTETTSLLNKSNGRTDKDVDAAVRCLESMHNTGGTAWRREAKILISSSGPLILTSFLHMSINLASVLAAGRIGKVELGAVSLANMSLSVTLMGPIQGLSTSLDTLCPQAYGCGRRHLVGLHCQRMTLCLLLLSVPVAVLWMFSEDIIANIVSDAESARLTALYLQVMIFAIPSMIVFETGKRLLQAQGLFKATTYILLVAAPVNLLLNWFLVHQSNLGFLGAPIAVAITRNLMALLLVCYVKFVNGAQCWGGFSKEAMTKWRGMIYLSIPGLIMVEAEWVALEFMTLCSGKFGRDYLAAQSALDTFASATTHVPFAMSVAASTRIATLIGAGRVDVAKVTAKAASIMACIIGALNSFVLIALRFQLPTILSKDESVILLTAQAIPFAAAMEFFEGLATSAHGLLRGIGRQSFGGPANLFGYYIISLPASIFLAFRLDWKLDGLWIGTTIGFIAVSVVEYIYLLKANWHIAAEEADARNASF